MRTLIDRVRDGRADKYLGLARVGAQAGCRVLLSVAVARLAGPEAFALFVQLIAIEVVIGTLWNAAYVTPLGSMLPGLPGDQRRAFLWHGLRRNRRAVLGSAAVLLIGTPIAIYRGVDGWLWLGFVLATAAWISVLAVVGALAACFRSGTALSGTMLGFAVPALAMWLVRETPELALLAFFWGQVVGQSMALFWMLRALPTEDEGLVDPHLQAEFRRFGRVAVTGSVANSACTRVQPFVLATVAGVIATGLFGAAQTLIGPLRVVGGALGEVLRPRLALHFGAEGDPNRGRRALFLGLVLVGLGGVVMLSLFAWQGQWLSELVFGPKFEGLAEVLPAAGLFVVFATIAHLLVVAMQSLSVDGSAEATRWRIRAALLSVAAVVPACWMGGARGAFVAMTFAEILFVLAAAQWLRSRLPREAPERVASPTGGV